jgi:tungstate transport system ATP-binding protein
MKAWVRLDHATLRLGAVKALDEVSLSIRADEAVALVGANGSGKSSLLRVLNGLLKPTSGDCAIEKTVRQSMVFQRPFMLRSTVQRNLALSAWLQGAAWADRHAVATRALERSGLSALAGRQARVLSSGQQQRLAVTRALAMQPQVLLLDEPTANLSPAAKRDVEQLMADCAAQGMGLVFASHNLGQVKRLAQRVIWLDAGRVRADCLTADFFNAPLVGHSVPPATLLMDDFG